MDLLPGLLILTASLEGFTTAVVQVQIFAQPSSQSVAISLSPVLGPQTEMRLVMNWGHLPSDLDLHVVQIDRFTSENPRNKIRQQCISGTLVVVVKRFMETSTDVLVFGLTLITPKVSFKKTKS